MKLLLLCEGNPETRDAWSGTTRSILDALRSAGNIVHARDTDLHGPARWLTAALAFAPRRGRWSVKYRLGSLPFRQRSRVARRHITEHRHEVDLILQVGATFEPQGRGSLPYFLYCDSNIHMATRLKASGYTHATWLTKAELDAIARREESVYRSAAAIFTISERLRRSFIEDFGLPSCKVHTVYAGPNFDLASVDYSRPPGQPSSHPTVLFVGKRFERKGGDLLLEAFARVRRRIPEARLLVVGPAQLAVSSPGVECLGFLDKDVPEDWQRLMGAYTAADVFCLPTRFDSFGIVFLEAMYFGVPCIGSDVYAVPEIIADGETGFVVRCDDVDMLADRLLRLLANRDLARAMGRAGRERVETCFSWSAVADRMMHTMKVSLTGRDRISAMEGS